MHLPGLFIGIRGVPTVVPYQLYSKVDVRFSLFFYPRPAGAVWCCLVLFPGDGNATVEVVMFSVEVPVPVGLVDDKIWIEDSFVKKDRVVK